MDPPFFSVISYLLASSTSTEPTGKALHYSVSTPEQSPAPDVVETSKSPESSSSNGGTKSKFPFSVTNPLKKRTSKKEQKGLPGAGEQHPSSGFQPSTTDSGFDTQMLVQQDDDIL